MSVSSEIKELGELVKRECNSFSDLKTQEQILHCEEPRMNYNYTLLAQYVSTEDNMIKRLLNSVFFIPNNKDNFIHQLFQTLIVEFGDFSSQLTTGSKSEGFLKDIVEIILKMLTDMSNSETINFNIHFVKPIKSIIKRFLSLKDNKYIEYSDFFYEQIINFLFLDILPFFGISNIHRHSNDFESHHKEIVIECFIEFIFLMLDLEGKIIKLIIRLFQEFKKKLEGVKQKIKEKIKPLISFFEKSYNYIPGKIIYNKAHLFFSFILNLLINSFYIAKKNLVSISAIIFDFFKCLKDLIGVQITGIDSDTLPNSFSESQQNLMISGLTQLCKTLETDNTLASSLEKKIEQHIDTIKKKLVIILLNSFNSGFNFGLNSRKPIDFPTAEFYLDKSKLEELSTQPPVNNNSLIDQLSTPDVYDIDDITNNSSVSINVDGVLISGTISISDETTSAGHLILTFEDNLNISQINGLIEDYRCDQIDAQITIDNTKVTDQMRIHNAKSIVIGIESSELERKKFKKLIFPDNFPGNHPTEQTNIDYFIYNDYGDLFFKNVSLEIPSDILIDKKLLTNKNPFKQLFLSSCIPFHETFLSLLKRKFNDIPKDKLSSIARDITNYANDLRKGYFDNSSGNKMILSLIKYLTDISEDTVIGNLASLLLTNTTNVTMTALPFISSSLNEVLTSNLIDFGIMLGGINAQEVVKIPVKDDLYKKLQQHEKCEVDIPDIYGKPSFKGVLTIENSNDDTHVRIKGSNFKFPDINNGEEYKYIHQYLDNLRRIRIDIDCYQIKDEKTYYYQHSGIHNWTVTSSDHDLTDEEQNQLILDLNRSSLDNICPDSLDVLKQKQDNSLKLQELLIKIIFHLLDVKGPVSQSFLNLLKEIILSFLHKETKETPDRLSFNNIFNLNLIVNRDECQRTKIINGEISTTRIKQLEGGMRYTKLTPGFRTGLTSGLRTGPMSKSMYTHWNVAPMAGPKVEPKVEPKVNPEVDPEVETMETVNLGITFTLGKDPKMTFIVPRKEILGLSDHSKFLKVKVNLDFKHLSPKPIKISDLQVISKYERNPKAHQHIQFYMPLSEIKKHFFSEDSGLSRYTFKDKSEQVYVNLYLLEYEYQEKELEKESKHIFTFSDHKNNKFFYIYPYSLQTTTGFKSFWNPPEDLQIYLENNDRSIMKEPDFFHPLSLGNNSDAIFNYYKKTFDLSNFLVQSGGKPINKKMKKAKHSRKKIKKHTLKKKHNHNLPRKISTFKKKFTDLKNSKKHQVSKSILAKSKRKIKPTRSLSIRRR